jgi:hypothetical protein
VCWKRIFAGFYLAFCFVKNGKMLKKHTQTPRPQKKKHIKKTKLSLKLFLMANFDRVNGPIESLERTPI